MNSIACTGSQTGHLLQQLLHNHKRNTCHGKEPNTTTHSKIGCKWTRTKQLKRPLAPGCSPSGFAHQFSRNQSATLTEHLRAAPRPECALEVVRGFWPNGKHVQKLRTNSWLRAWCRRARVFEHSCIQHSGKYGRQRGRGDLAIVLSADWRAPACIKRPAWQLLQTGCEQFSHACALNVGHAHRARRPA
jgi:hypothetical protein